MHNFETYVYESTISNVEFIGNQCERTLFIDCDFQGLAAEKNSVITPGVCKLSQMPDQALINTLLDMGIVVVIEKRYLHKC